jgi:hypothetical protein
MLKASGQSQLQKAKSSDKWKNKKMPLAAVKKP